MTLPYVTMLIDKSMVCDQQQQMVLGIMSSLRSCSVNYTSYLVYMKQSESDAKLHIKYATFHMQDKEGSIPHEDLGKSIATVQVLQRKHETFEREVAALGNKVCT